MNQKEIDNLNEEQKKYNKETSQKKELAEVEISPNVNELSGIISLPKDFDPKTKRRKHLKEK